jgi:alanyl-tRNA synthetase
MFLWSGDGAAPEHFEPDNKLWVEIWNDVFMQYEKTEDGSYIQLKQSNVDTGMGVERTIAMLQGQSTVYNTELFKPIMEVISEMSGKHLTDENGHAFRVIADHIRSSVFVLGDAHAVSPGNLGQGYVLRRLIRRSVRYAKQLGLNEGFSKSVAECIIDNYKKAYPELDTNRSRIISELVDEETKFEKTLNSGMGELNKIISRMKEHNQTTLPGRVAFKLYDTSGFPLEFTEEICSENGFDVDKAGFDKAFEKHKAVSRQGAEKAFKGGLADASEETTKLHTATHLLHQALKTVLGDHVQQKGSNINVDRLRFDFSHPEKMTPEQKEEVTALVNAAIQADYAVTMETMTIEEAKEQGAIALFTAKYDEQVKVYTIGDFSKEVCGGPHVERTGTLGRFKIKKEGSSSAGVRRIKAVLVND